MKEKKRGFTLVELVIVIAVIAILAGVMIAVFSNVVNKANESAKLQDEKQAEMNQKLDDIEQKLSNQSWLGWEDFENELASQLAASDANTDEAINNALEEYAKKYGQGNTGLTEDQVQTIIERALAGQLTSEQVETIVKKYTASIDTTATLTTAQINQIKAAATANSLTEAQVKAVVSALLTDQTATIDTAVKAALADSGLSTLTSEEIAAKIDSTMAKYYRNGIYGDYAALEVALDSDITTFTVGASGDLSVDAFRAIAGLSAEGKDFAGITFTLLEDVDLSGTSWTPIGTNREAPFKGVIEGNNKTVAIKIDNNFNAVQQGFMIDCGSSNNNDKFGVGFIASLAEGGELKNITLVVNIDISDCGVDGVQVGGAVGYLCGGAVSNVTVKGSVKNHCRAGGIVGAYASGSLTDCTNDASVTSTGTNYSGYHAVSGIVGYFRDFATEKGSTQNGVARSIVNCTNNGVLTSTQPTWVHGIVGQFEGNQDKCTITNCVNNYNSDSITDTP